ncbi:MAG: carboxypeptidase regulatory-like domain-containing protein, partial [Planctomycetes bacterium]|nr:carboxypeptidase regulatory-like domain-containing protein [Planctomycetota bacterium]
MTMWFKLLATGLAVAATVWLLLTQPWATIDPPPRLEQHAQAPTTAPAGDLVHDAHAPTKPPLPNAERTPIASPPAPVTLVVTGTVVDATTNAPLAAVPVQLLTWATGTVNTEGLTAADGTFTLRDTRGGKAELRQLVVRALDYAPMRKDVSYEPPPTAPQTIELGTLPLVRGTL